MPQPSSDHEFEVWVEKLTQDPFGAGPRGIALLLVILVVTGVVGLYGLLLFPPVPLPRIILALPGLAAGGLAFWSLRRLFFRGSPAILVPIVLVTVLVAAVFGYVFFMAIT